MNYLAIDYGTVRVGIAVSVNGFITTLPPLKCDQNLLQELTLVITDYSINKIFVGLSRGSMKEETLKFVDRLRAMLELTVETVEEEVSTIEADQIYKSNKNKKKNYKHKIDSIAAAVILRRAIS
ncbi:MAG: Holliday junction resolvase RuvX [Candidatus Shapirobacteria bacterium]|jgi:putative Holliday junction resolvase